MKIHSQPRTFVLTLSDTESLSKMGELNKSLGKPMLDDLIVSLKKYNWNYEIYPAQDGYLMKNSQWQEEQILIENHCGMRTLSGAIGCLYSHLQLWKKCLEIQEPIIVLEHDALITDYFPKEVDLNCDLLKLGHPFPEHDKFHSITGEWKLGAWGYLITPSGCSKLINALKKYGTIPTDVLIGKLIIDWNYLEPSICELNHISLLQSSTSLRNERLKTQKWTNPFMTKEELIDWLEYVFKRKNLRLVFEFENKYFNDEIRTVSDTFDLLIRSANNNLIVQSVSNGDVYELEVDKIKELNFV